MNQKNSDIISMMEENRTMPMTVIPPEIYRFNVGRYLVEIIFDDEDVIFHLYDESYPPDVKARLIKVIDSIINDQYTVGYEPLVNSWFIRIFKFAATRTDPVSGAKGIINTIISKLSEVSRA